MPPRIGDYHAPADGTPESADPHFVARTRDCGFCGREFVTSAAFRYYCEHCRGKAVRLNPAPKKRLKAKAAARALD